MAEPPQLSVGPRRVDPLRSVLLFDGALAASSTAAPRGATGGSTTAAFRSPAPRLPSALALRPSSVLTPGPPPGGAGGFLGTHPYAAASFAEAAAFNRSEVADRIRRSFDAMVARSPIGVHLQPRLLDRPASFAATLGSPTLLARANGFGSPAVVPGAGPPLGSSPSLHLRQRREELRQAGPLQQLYPPPLPPQVLGTTEWRQVVQQQHSPGFQAVSTVHSVHNRTLLQSGGRVGGGPSPQQHEQQQQQGGFSVTELPPSGGEPLVEELASRSQHTGAQRPRQQQQQQQQVAWDQEAMMPPRVHWSLQQQQQQERASQQQQSPVPQQQQQSSSREAAAAAEADEAVAAALAAVAARATAAAPATATDLWGGSATPRDTAGLEAATVAAVATTGDLAQQLGSEAEEGDLLPPGSGSSSGRAPNTSSQQQQQDQQPVEPTGWQQEPAGGPAPALDAASPGAAGQGAAAGLPGALLCTGHRRRKVAGRKRVAMVPVAAPAQAAGADVGTEKGGNEEQEQQREREEQAARPAKIARCAGGSRQLASAPPAAANQQAGAQPAGSMAATVVPTALVQATRSGRKRLPPLAFWAGETKVMGRDGGVQGVVHLTSLPDQTGGGSGTVAESEKPKQAMPVTAKKPTAAAAASSRSAGVVAPAAKRGNGVGGSKPAAAQAGEAPKLQKQRQQQDSKSGRQGSAMLLVASQAIGAAAVPALTAGKKPGSRSAAQRSGAAAAAATPAPKGGVAAMAAAAGAQAAAAARAATVAVRAPAAAAAAAGHEASRKPAGAAKQPDQSATPAKAAAAGGGKKRRVGKGGEPPLPEVPGVTPETVRRMAATPRQAGRKCGECWHCRNPQHKKKCLAATALDKAEDELLEGAAQGLQQLAEADTTGERQQRQEQRKDKNWKLPIGKAGKAATAQGSKAKKQGSAGGGAGAAAAKQAGWGGGGQQDKKRAAPEHSAPASDSDGGAVAASSLPPAKQQRGTKPPVEQGAAAAGGAGEQQRKGLGDRPRKEQPAAQKPPQEQQQQERQERGPLTAHSRRTLSQHLKPRRLLPRGSRPVEAAPGLLPQQQRSLPSTSSGGQGGSRLGGSPGDAEEDGDLDLDWDALD